MLTFRLFLQNHPELMVRYVSTGTFLVDMSLSTLTKIMRHLLIVQSIDPNSQPGEKFRKALQDSVSNVVDKKDFDDDYDFSWIKKCFDKTREQMNQLSLTKQQYWNMTNISMLDSPNSVIVNDCPKECHKKELPLVKVCDLNTPESRKTARKNIIKKAKNKANKVVESKVKKVVRKASKPLRVHRVEEDSNVEAVVSPKIPNEAKKKGVFRRIS